MLEELKTRVDTLYLEYVFPVLATLRLGEDPAAVAFETELLAAAKAAGIRVRRYIMPDDLSREDVAGLIRETKQEFSRLIFVIGGSDGLPDSVKKACAVRMSMGRMTFPHQMARMILMEQLYRAETINAGMKYHK